MQWRLDANGKWAISAVEQIRVWQHELVVLRYRSLNHEMGYEIRPQNT